METLSKKPLSVVFFCGAESPYGSAHLTPILNESGFRLVATVLATPERWKKFRTALTGSESGGPEQGIPLSTRIRRGFGVLRHPSKGLLVRLLKQVFFRQPTGTDSVVRVCRKARVPLWFEVDINREAFIAKLSDLQPDLAICAAYPQIFRKPLIRVPRLGVINSHPSLLPRYRGAHPLFWAVAMGERESGLTAHLMEERIDAGPIVAQIPFPIAAEDSYSDVYERALNQVPLLVRKVGDYLKADHATPLLQDETQATFFREDRDIHHVLFWSVYEAQRIWDLVRAADGRAFFPAHSERVLVSACGISRDNRKLTNPIQVPPGTVIDNGDPIAIAVKDGVVTLKQWKTESGRKMRFHVGQWFP